MAHRDRVDPVAALSLLGATYNHGDPRDRGRHFHPARKIVRSGFALCRFYTLLERTRLLNELESTFSRFIHLLRDGRPIELTLRQFVDFWHFFEWGQCRWLLAQEEKERSCSRLVAQHRRSQLVNHIPSRWGNARLSELDGVRI